ncbi:MAG: ACP S-malonyltransferase, partial [Oscillospiraceae bacterium]
AVLAAAGELKPQALGKPAAAAGHSLGEYSALAAAGALGFEDAVKLSRRRGELMQKAGDDHPGLMAAVIGLETEKVEKAARENGVYVANYNSPGQIILSGEKDKLDKACKEAMDAGARFTVPLQVSGAFHSPLMQDAQEGLNKELETVEIRKPEFPIIGNTTAKVLDPTAEAIRTELMTQLCHSVQWIKTLNTMKDMGIDTFIEIGPGNVLTKLVKRTLPEANTIMLGTMEDIEAL